MSILSFWERRFSFSSLITDSKFAMQVSPCGEISTFELFSDNADSVSFSPLLSSMKLCAVKVRIQGISSPPLGISEEY